MRQLGNKTGRHIQRISVLLVLLCALLAGCRRAAPAPQAVELTFETVHRYDESGGFWQYEPALLVMTHPRDIEGWKRPGVYDKTGSALDERTLERFVRVDFNRAIVIGVFQGEKPSSGYHVQVRRIVRQGQTVTLYGNFIQPFYGQLVTGGTVPYHVLALHKAGLEGQEIRFVLEVDGENVAETTVLIP